jgi:hypothetical protein
VEEVRRGAIQSVPAVPLSPLLPTHFQPKNYRQQKSGEALLDNTKALVLGNKKMKRNNWNRELGCGLRLQGGKTCEGENKMTNK